MPGIMPCPRTASWCLPRETPRWATAAKAEMSGKESVGF